MCGMEYRLKKGSVYEGKVEKVDFPNKATVWVTDEDGQNCLLYTSPSPRDA